jgi:hypothetical protein
VTRMSTTSDLTLDGTLCSGCGVFINDDGAAGVPRQCEECEGKRSRRRERKHKGQARLPGETGNTQKHAP